PGGGRQRRAGSALAGFDQPRPQSSCRGRRRVRRRGSPARAGRPSVRGGGQWDSRLAGTAAGHRPRCGRRPAGADRPSGTVTAEEVGAAAQLACLLEVSAPKPGNVSPERHFHDTRYEDFLASAVAIGPALADAGKVPLGATVRRAVDDTLQWTRSNTNLGIVLLLAPLARAALAKGGSLRNQLATVLAGTTVEDAAEVYAAIRQARPGGLGSSTAEDVTRAPT